MISRDDLLKKLQSGAAYDGDCEFVLVREHRPLDRLIARHQHRNDADGGRIEWRSRLDLAQDAHLKRLDEPALEAVVTASTLRQIILDLGKIWASAPPAGLHLRGLWIQGDLNLDRSQAHPQHERGVIPIVLENCYLDGGISARDANLTKLSLINTFVQEIDLSGAHVEHDLQFENITLLRKEGYGADRLRLGGALVAPSLEVNGGVSAALFGFEALSLKDARIAGSLDISVHSTVTRGNMAIELSNAHIEGGVRIVDLPQPVAIEAQAAHIGGALELLAPNADPGGSACLGAINLAYAQIGAAVSLQKCTINGDVNSYGIQLPGVNLHGAKVAADFFASDCEIAGGLLFDLAEIGGDVRFQGKEALSATSSQASIAFKGFNLSVRGNVSFYGVIEGENKKTKLSPLRLDGKVWLENATIHGDLSFLGAELTGDEVSLYIRRSRIGAITTYRPDANGGEPESSGGEDESTSGGPVKPPLSDSKKLPKDEVKRKEEVKKSDTTESDDRPRGNGLVATGAIAIIQSTMDRVCDFEATWIKHATDTRSSWDGVAFFLRDSQIGAGLLLSGGDERRELKGLIALRNSTIGGTLELFHADIIAPKSCAIPSLSAETLPTGSTETMEVSATASPTTKNTHAGKRRNNNLLEGQKQIKKKLSRREAIQMYQVKVQSDLKLDDRRGVKDKIRSPARICGVAAIEHCEILGDLTIGNADFAPRDAWNIVDLEVKEQKSAGKSVELKFKNDAHVDPAQPALSLRGTRIEGDLYIRNGKRGSFLEKLGGAKDEKPLRLGLVSLVSAKLRSFDDFERGNSKDLWGYFPVVNRRRLVKGVMLDLDGCEYGRFKREGVLRGKWLERQFPANWRLTKKSRFSFDSYETAARMLREGGHHSQARRIATAGLRMELWTHAVPHAAPRWGLLAAWLQWLASFFFWILYDFGYGARRAVVILAAWLAFGWYLTGQAESAHVLIEKPAAIALPAETQRSAQSAAPQAAPIAPPPARQAAAQPPPQANGESTTPPSPPTPCTENSWAYAADAMVVGIDLGIDDRCDFVDETQPIWGLKLDAPGLRALKLAYGLLAGFFTLMATLTFSGILRRDK
jgi:hypothetical protein